jgi:DNA invertase Pin-like site-specific DNA recombinase
LSILDVEAMNEIIKITHGNFRLINRIFNISACFAKFERDLIRERTNEGLAAARARGRKGGRRQWMTKEAEKKAILAEFYYKQKDMAVNKIA